MKKFTAITAAATLLFAVGNANAAIIQEFTVSGDSVLTGNGTMAEPGLVEGTVTFSGTATLDDAGILTMNYGATTNLDAYAEIAPGFVVLIQGLESTLVTETIMTGAFSGGDTITWAAAGTSTTTECIGAALVCDQITLGTTPWAPQENPITFGLNNGDITFLTVQDSVDDPSLQITGTNYDLTAVPVPAAAWLFGSGLIGLAGVARRRRLTA